MARRSKKEILLDAMRIILQEYKAQTHINRMDKCSLCIKFRNDEIVDSCKKCPMNLFDLDSIVPCMQRKCYPIDCKSMNNSELDGLRLKCVIQFYEQVISKIESMTNAEFLKTDFSFLIEIDNEVYDKFKDRFDELMNHLNKSF